VIVQVRELDKKNNRIIKLRYLCSVPSQHSLVAVSRALLHLRHSRYKSLIASFDMYRLVSRVNGRRILPSHSVSLFTSDSSHLTHVRSTFSVDSPPVFEKTCATSKKSKSHIFYFEKTVKRKNVRTVSDQVRTLDNSFIYCGC